MKKAIVVGASSGIGREVALLLARQGWMVGIAARRTDKLTLLIQEVGENAVAAHIDVCAPDAGERLMQLIGQLGGMDLYFHASGIGKQNPGLDMQTEQDTVKTNVEGFMRMVNAAFNWFAQNGKGQIAVISSIAGTRGLGPAPAYSATKAFQNNYIEALEQLANSRGLDIAFTDIRPGFVDTDLLAGGRYPMLMDKQKVARSIVRAVLGRKHVCVIDYRYRVLTCLWRWVPRWLWRRFNLVGRTV